MEDEVEDDKVEDDDVEKDDDDGGDAEDEEEEEADEDGWGRRPIPRPGPPLCASLRGRNALQHVTRATLYGNLPEKCRAPEAGPTHFVRACAVEMHVNISQEPLYMEIYRKNARPEWAPWSGTGLYIL